MIGTLGDGGRELQEGGEERWIKRDQKGGRVRQMGTRVRVCTDYACETCEYCMADVSGGGGRVGALLSHRNGFADRAG